MNEKKLLDLYKKQLAQSSEKAPEGLWEDIAREMDADDEKQLIHHYKEELAQSAEKAPAGLWDDIARRMDIDEVWEGVAAKLDEEEKAGGFWWLKRGIAAAITILLITTMSVWFLRNLSSPEIEFASIETEWIDPITVGQPEETTPEHTRQPELSISIDGSNGQPKAIQEIKSTALASLQEQDSISQKGSSFHTNFQEYPLAYSASDLYPITAIMGSVEAIGRPTLQQFSTDSYVEERSSFLLSLSETDANTNVLTLGFTTAMKNTWLFNHETFQGFNPSSGSRTHVQIYPDIAMSLRYLLSERWEMESNISFSSNTGQSYEQYIFGRYSQREITLNYFQAEFLAGYKHQKRWVVLSNTITHGTSVGLYYGMLNAANESIAGEKEDVSTLYRKDDFGIVTGHNLNIPIIGNLMFSPGLYITWGLPNIYQGQYTLPSLKRTHNRSVELRFSLYYNFLR